MPRTRYALLTALLLLGAAACDNVGRAFDRDVDGEEPVPGSGETTIEVVPVGGDSREGRPKVRSAQPNGGGWPTAVPIVIEFSESMNQSSIRPSTPTGTDARVILRVRGTTQVLPCQYDFVGNGRVLVMRPVTELSNAQTPVYEVVLLPDVRDADGVRFQVPDGELVLTDFQVNQDAAFTDGRILTTYPRDNARDAVRETDYWVFFDRPANQVTVTATSLRLRQAGGADQTGQRSFPLLSVGQQDGRAVRFRPQAALLGGTSYELVVDDTITFGTDGELDFRGRTPFAQFETVAPAAPVGVELDDPVVGFPNKINQSKLATTRLRITTAADGAAGDRVLVRIYGGDAKTTATGDIAFVERTVEVPLAGAQTVTADFSGLLGTLLQPGFDDGALTFTVQTLRGSVHSGFTHNGGDDDAVFDITLPTLRSVGPPSPGDSSFDVLTDQEDLALFGTASEPVGAVELVVGTQPAVNLYATADDGTFLLAPVAVGRTSVPLTYSLTLTDRAGNLATNSVQGQVVQRGVAVDDVSTAVVVEVYDHATLLPIANASVFVDPAVPTVPATGQLVGATLANGRVEFAGIGGADHTISVARPGYHLVTVARTAATYLSIPLVPIDGGLATLRGTVAFTQAAGTTALIGCTAFDDANVLAVQTANASPTTIPPTSIRPNRPAFVSAFGGVFEPTSPVSFTLQGIPAFSGDLQDPTLAPPASPPAAGGTADQAIVMLPAAGLIGTLGAVSSKDLAEAVGLDTGNLVGGRPTVRVASTLRGFGGQLLTGVGLATLDTGTTYELTASWSLAAMVGFGAFGVANGTWLVGEAVDTGGRRARYRHLFNVLTGQFSLPAAPLLPIPSITIPGGSSTGAPAVEFVDGIDAAATIGGVGTVDLIATDASGRSWTMLVPDDDAAGGTDTVQFPDLGTSGLATGTWNIRADARLWVSVPGATRSDFLFTSRRRDEFSRSVGVAIPFTVQ
ncbi:MAG: hypothetical protein JNL08_01375 [Planctomycetes bacterium]|nr:hypothetical protein [Planctomycetota bacterium]